MKAAKPVKISTKSRNSTPQKISQRNWLKTLTLIIATVLSLLGSAGQFAFVERFDAEIGARTAEMRDIEARAATLRTTQNEYFNSYIQANLLFALNPADVSVNRGVTAQMYQLAIIDRAFPFRAILGEMAIAGLFEFKGTNDQYRTLSEKARADMSYESYNALNMFEKDILDRALTLQHTLQDRFFVAQNEKAAAEVARDNRRVWLTAMTALGTILLLAANLMEERKKSSV
jgi:hypothetical protein